MKKPRRNANFPNASPAVAATMDRDQTNEDPRDGLWIPGAIKSEASNELGASASDGWNTSASE